MKKPRNNLIAIKTKQKERATLLAHKFACDTYDFNAKGEKILIDQPAALNALKRAYYKLCTSPLPCVWIKLTAEEARGFPRNHDLNHDSVCVLAAIHCADGCYGYSIGKCDSHFLNEVDREREAGKMAVDLAFDVALDKYALAT